MSHADFVHLRVHTAYSLSEGAIKVDRLIGLCREEGMPAVAITDTGNLFGALEFAIAAKAAGVQPVIGCQLAVRRTADGGPGARRPVDDQLVLLVQDEAGYKNLLKLVSKSYLATEPGEDPHVTLDDLAERSDGLIALTAGPRGWVGRLLADGQGDAARAALERLAALFPGRLYVELMRHGLAEEARIENPLVDLAYAFDLPLLATNEVFFEDEEMYEAHDALICIAERSYVGESDRRRLTPEHRFKSAAEMKALFADLPEAIVNTLVVARRCAYMPEPCDPILPAYPAAREGRTEAEELRVQAEAGLEKRLEDHVYSDGMDSAAREAAARPYRERLARELDIIEGMGFPGYFLIVADFIQWAKAQEIPVGPGRGSGAGSLVAYALTITDLDPLRWGLLFERFLNPERISMPDFDVDFCQDRRDEVIHYVQQTYGEDRVAQIITFGKLQARAALRDVGRVLQMPYPQVDRICKLVPNNPANPVTLAEAIQGEPQLQEMRRTDEGVAGLIDIALKLEGLYRHASTHAAGVVIGDKPLDEMVPLYRDPRSPLPVTQFNMKYVEQAGLVKFDFLGLKTLTVIEKARQILAERGVDLDPSHIPLDDRRTFDMLAHADAAGVFQLESQGMRDVLRQLEADRFEDLIAVVALYRPGPMENIPSYIARKHGREEPDYLHPSLEPILKETFGIMIYQEQVMQIAQVLAGYTLGGADVLRRAMGKKIKSVMDAERAKFVDGAVSNGVDRAKAAAIFEQVEKFAGYGFNKSHAAAYALVAYQTAYLKANYPVEFLAALMTLDINNTDKLGAFRRELDRLGIELLPPDINASGAEFTVERDAEGTGAVRYALGALKNVGRAAMAAVVAEREANGPFMNLGDFARRIDTETMNRRQLENLVRAGAFDRLNPNRRAVFEGIDRILAHASSAASDRGSGQESLFGGAGEQETDIDLPKVSDWPMMDRLRHEFEAVGFYLSAHPLDAYGKSLPRLGVVSAAELSARVAYGGGVLKLAGTALSKRERTSRKGDRFAFIQLSDHTGMYEVTAFREVLSASRELIEESIATGAPLLVTVDVRPEGDALRITATGITLLEDVAANTDAGVRVFVSDPEALEGLKAMVERAGQGRGRLAVVVDADDAEVEIVLPGAYKVSPGTRSAIKAVPGVVHVEEV